MTKREYYDLLVKSAHDGTFPSFEWGKCLYRNADGSKRCAIGVLIPDEAYRPEYESCAAAWNLERLLTGPWCGYMPEGLDCMDLTTIQGIHDHHAVNGTRWKPEDFVRELNRLECFKEFHGTTVGDVPQGEPEAG